MTNGGYSTGQHTLEENTMKKKRFVFISKQDSVCGYTGGKKLNKKYLSISVKNFFNQTFYVYEFPDGSNEHRLCSICFKAILRKIEQNMQ